MKIGIIGYGSMGKMIFEKISHSDNANETKFFISNRTKNKINYLTDICTVCESNKELASQANVIFLCVRPYDLREVLIEIKGSISEDTLLVSLNGSIKFEQIEKLCKNKIAKVTPSITAEVNQSQTLVCYNSYVSNKDKAFLTELLQCMGNVIELPENEIGMGGELVSCMPGFIAAIFNEIFISAKKHTNIADEQIIEMLLNTMVGTGELMIEGNYSFEDVISRVATKGGITEEGIRIIHENFPDVINELFEKTLEKRRKTAEIFQNKFNELDI